MKSMPKVSVVTVVYNDTSGLERTIKSVINQTYQNIEFIIIDGGSTDGTVNVIKKYEEKIDYWVSEKDKGIYDAMNKGIQASTGKWVNFMNAGDVFVDNEVLQKINLELFEDVALVYGKKIQNNKIVNPLSLKMLEVGQIHANHQSMFFNRVFLKGDLIYNLKYKIYGDYELVNKIYIKYPQQIRFVDQVIADFEGGGVSSTPSFQKRKDKYVIIYNHYGLLSLIKSVIYRIKKIKHAFI